MKTNHATHTPGPWAVEPRDRYSVQMGGQVAIVAPGPDGATYDEQAANAALIASAPDLLAALEAMVDASWNGPIDADHPARQKAAAALAKTRGETRGEPEPEAAEPLARIGQFMGGREVKAT